MRERQASSAVGIPWEALEQDGALRSRGGRRAAILQFIEPPQLVADPEHAQRAELTFALAAGNYASTAASAWDIVWQRSTL